MRKSSGPSVQSRRPRSKPEQVEEECQKILALIDKHGEVTSEFVQKDTGFSTKVTVSRMRKLRYDSVLKFRRSGNSVVWSRGQMVERVFGEPEKIPFHVDFSQFPKRLQRWCGYVAANA